MGILSTIELKKEILPRAEQPPAQERFLFIDSLRGMAALAIACYHIHRYGPLREPAETLLPDLLEYAVKHGWMGVQVFFVIAGFVGAYALRNATATPAFFCNFSLRRLIRLGGPYWAVLVLVAGLNYFVVSLLQDLSLSGQVTWPQFCAHVTFLQDILSYKTICAGLWFVSIDLQWGFVFCLLLGLSERNHRNHASDREANGRLLIALFFPPALLALFVFNPHDRFDMWIIYFFHMPLFGALAWWTLDKRTTAIAFWAYAAALLAGLAIRMRLEIAIATLTGLTIYLAGQSGGLSGWLSARPLHYLGRISYSLFLIHYPASWVVIKLGHCLTGTRPLPAVLWLGLALAASIAAAHLLYVLVEKPTLQLARRLKPSGM